MSENPDLDKVYLALKNINNFSQKEKEILMSCLINFLPLESCLEINTKLSKKMDFAYTAYKLQLEKENFELLSNGY
jgi:hypothetical protein